MIILKVLLLVMYKGYGRVLLHLKDMSITDYFRPVILSKYNILH